MTIVVLFVWGDVNEEMIDQERMKKLSSKREPCGRGRKMTIRVVIVVFILLLPWFVVARGLLSGLGIAARNLLFWKM